MEEHTGKKVNTERSQEAIATGASRIAVACPFCYVMFDDGVKGEGKNEEVQGPDIAEMLWEAIENGGPTRAQPAGPPLHPRRHNPPMPPHRSDPQPMPPPPLP